VRADGSVGSVEAMRICADVARGLAAAHARGLVHRDVKPGNVIVTAEGAKLVDFGLAASIGEPDEADENGIMFGTPAYLAPERLEDGVVVPGSDVYAVGLLLYRLLAGHTPWSAQTTTQMLKAHAYLPPEPLPPVEGVPAQVADLCRRCLAKNPADRPSAAAVATVLTEAATGAAGLRAATGGTEASGSSDAAAGAGAVGPAGDVRSRDPSRRRLAAVAAVLAVVAAGLALVVFRPFDGSPAAPDAAGQPPAIGGIPVPEPSFPRADGGSGGPSTGPGGPGVVPGGTPAGTGAGTGVGGPGGTPGAPGPGPGDGTPAPGPGGDSPTTDPARREVDTAGGSAVVECTGTIAGLITWAPAAGYQTQNAQPGPGPSVQVMFRAGKNHVTIRAKCVNGVPDVTVTEDTD
jgi:eukaryotic-like serine/threonine-protein kinase